MCEKFVQPFLCPECKTGWLRNNEPVWTICDKMVEENDKRVKEGKEKLKPGTKCPYGWQTKKGNNRIDWNSREYCQSCKDFD
ncbi:hypothetical protein B0T16DRAFT_423820 [Cercophora newfieldiana]|uniref:Uncharacterized protein n=1 Tax=Cercophora newfieldiana TaxID=92897 RepID=A0AA39XTB9_9PEZI|nr:hypothetical protein B0T16DRAFT_423820 [Cercophora newfieldiana]